MVRLEALHRHQAACAIGVVHVRRLAGTRDAMPEPGEACRQHLAPGGDVAAPVDACAEVVDEVRQRRRIGEHHQRAADVRAVDPVARAFVGRQHRFATGDRDARELGVRTEVVAHALRMGGPVALPGADQRAQPGAGHLHLPQFGQPARGTLGRVLGGRIERRRQHRRGIFLHQPGPVQRFTVGGAGTGDHHPPHRRTPGRLQQADGAEHVHLEHPLRFGRLARRT